MTRQGYVSRRGCPVLDQGMDCGNTHTHTKDTGLRSQLAEDISHLDHLFAL